MDAIYHLSGRRAAASRWAAGPWDASLQHGAAPAALIAWAAGGLTSDVPMRIARMTIDFMRPVPVAPLEIRSDIVRQGRKIQLAGISLFADGVEVVRASVLKIRVASAELPEQAGGTAPDLCPPDGDAGADNDAPRIKSPFLDGMSIRRVRQPARGAGSARIWFRAERPIVDGAPITPVMRAAITADFCNGASMPLDPAAWTFINGDLSLSLARMPVGDWILLDAESWLGPDGVGLAFGRLADGQGYFGRAAQSLILERR